jgi:hypothetical protein
MTFPNFVRGAAPLNCTNDEKWPRIVSRKGAKAQRQRTVFTTKSTKHTKQQLQISNLFFVFFVFFVTFVVPHCL